MERVVEIDVAYTEDAVELFTDEWLYEFAKAICEADRHFKTVRLTTDKSTV